MKFEYPMSAKIVDGIWCVIDANGFVVSKHGSKSEAMHKKNNMNDGYFCCDTMFAFSA